MIFFFNPDAEEFVPKAKEEHRHSGERNGCSLGRGEAGNNVGKQTRWGVGQLNSGIENEGMHRAKNQKAYIVKGKIRKKKKKTEGSDQASAGKVCSTRSSS